MYLIISTSLRPQSRSRAMAACAASLFEQRRLECSVIDLAALSLPDCDGEECYRHPEVRSLAQRIADAKAILIASPVYNYDLSASAKRLIELTGDSWEDKVVGFLAAAGGDVSFMSVMGLANSLMLDFRSVIVPRFVFATDDAFRDGQIHDPNLVARIERLVDETHRLASALGRGGS
jgi:FMN reductase